jgi:hypothetical protein
MRCSGGCGVGGEDDPLLNAHPNVDMGEQYDGHDPRFCTASLNARPELDLTVTEVYSLELDFFLKSR